jgi:hypothetical protein
VGGIAASLREISQSRIPLGWSLDRAGNGSGVGEMNVSSGKKTGDARDLGHTNLDLTAQVDRYSS